MRKSTLENIVFWIVLSLIVGGMLLGSWWLVSKGADYDSDNAIEQVRRYSDEEAGVTCWTLKYGTGVAIDCMLTSDTKLGE